MAGLYKPSADYPERDEDDGVPGNAIEPGKQIRLEQVLDEEGDDHIERPEDEERNAEDLG